MRVAPYMGAWIEISIHSSGTQYPNVAPYMGAWIEIKVELGTAINPPSRSLHGSVD